MKYALTLVALSAVLLSSGAAFADRPEWAGRGKHDREEHERHFEDRHEDREARHGHFDERHRRVVYEYYGEEFRRGHCPPGLAKKHNGCMPPGHAKKWHPGDRLPREVVYYDVPAPVVMQLPQPQPGYRYVRVASDILLIATGTGMVMDAIMDLGHVPH